MYRQTFFQYLTIFSNSLFKKLQNLHYLNLLAFSGGQDSMFLLSYMILVTKLKKRIKFQVLHLNHLIQKNNFYFSLMAFQLSFLLDLDFYFSVPCSFLKNEFESSLWRYSKFFRVANFSFCKHVWLAHSNTDQCEKLFLNFFRGSKTWDSGFLKFNTQLYVNSHSQIFYNWK